MKHLSNRLSLFSRDEKGAVLVTVALIMVALLGTAALAVDVGALYQTRRQMVSAADAAALAGARELILNPSGVEEKTKYYAHINGADVNIGGVDDQFSLSTTANSVTVITGKKVDYLFARFLGLSDTVVSAGATAACYPLVGLGGLIPIGIPDLDYQEGEIFDLVTRDNHEIFGPGNWAYIDLDDHPGGGVPQLADRLLNGYDEKVYVGDTVKTETGNKTNPNAVMAALQHHIDEQNILFVPIVDVSGERLTGVDSVKILGFAAVILTRVYTDGPGNSGDLRVEGKFVKFVEAGDVDPDATDYDLYGVKLIK